MVSPMNDEWTTVKEFPNYEVSKNNGIRRKGSNRQLKGRNWIGYPKVTLMRDGKKHERRVHKLVAEHFVKRNNPQQTIVNHKNSNRADYRADNLEYMTQSENMLHRWKTEKEGRNKMKYSKEYDTTGLSKVAWDLKDRVKDRLQNKILGGILLASAAYKLGDYIGIIQEHNRRKEKKPKALVKYSNAKHKGIFYWINKNKKMGKKPIAKGYSERKRTEKAMKIAKRYTKARGKG